MPTTATQEPKGLLETLLYQWAKWKGGYPSGAAPRSVVRTPMRIFPIINHGEEYPGPNESGKTKNGVELVDIPHRRVDFAACIATESSEKATVRRRKRRCDLKLVHLAHRIVCVQCIFFPLYAICRLQIKYSSILIAIVVVTCPLVWEFCCSYVVLGVNLLLSHPLNLSCARSRPTFNLTFVVVFSFARIHTACVVSMRILRHYFYSIFSLSLSLSPTVKLKQVHINTEWASPCMGNYRFHYLTSLVW